ncbi:MAG: peptidase, partial [Clostridia bacterium]|nr:peptidase [Clostridia bacterium]
LIHRDNDDSEETWINEGMSDFAEYLCGYESYWGHVNFFLQHPENSLVEWDEHYSAPTGPEVLADYGQAFLMQLYLNDKYGKDFVKALAQDPDHGIESANKILTQFNTNIDFEELFRRFSIAVAIDSPQPGNGIYNFESIDLNIDYASALTYDKDGVPAWGADYKEIPTNLAKKVQDITIDGIDFLPNPWVTVEKDGRTALWGNYGDERANQLIFKADLTNVIAATLNFEHYYNIEEQWDFGVVQVSADGGTTWTSLSNANTRSDIVDEGYPAIKAAVPGFTGTNGQWTAEAFDLSAYAGKEILVNFNYMTDWGSNEEGWFIDNIAIPEIGYANDCTSLDSFMSIDEINKNYVEYALVFINQKSLGVGSNESNYNVLNIDPMNISEADAIQLKEFLSGGNTYMIVWYAAPVGTKGAVDFTYEITTKSENAKVK